MEGRFNICMSHKLLQPQDIATIVDVMNRKRVPKRMRMNVLLQPRTLHNLFNNVLNTPNGNRTPPLFLVFKQIGRRMLCQTIEISSQRRPQLSRIRNSPQFIAFAIHNRQGHINTVEIAQTKSANLT